MTNGKHKLDCKCLWDDNNEVIAFCGAHEQHHQTLTAPLLRDKAALEYIKIYAKTEHPIISSKACPLCEWDSEVKDGFWVGRNRKPCTFHFALNQLYALKIEGEEDIWKDDEN